MDTFPGLRRFHCRPVADNLLAPANERAQCSSFQAGCLCEREPEAELPAQLPARQSSGHSLSGSDLANRSVMYAPPVRIEDLRNENLNSRLLVCLSGQGASTAQHRDKTLTLSADGPLGIPSFVFLAWSHS